MKFLNGKLGGSLLGSMILLAISFFFTAVAVENAVTTMNPTTAKEIVNTTNPATAKEVVNTTDPTTAKEVVTTTNPTTAKEVVTTTNPTTAKEVVTAMYPEEVTTMNLTTAKDKVAVLDPTAAKKIPTVDLTTTTTTTVDPKKHDCDFSSKTQMETQRVMLTCRCRVSANRCPYCTMKIQYLSIEPLQPAPWVVPQLSSTPRWTSEDYVRNSTYGFTLNQTCSGVDGHPAGVTFACHVQGVDYTWHAKDQDYRLAINFSNYYNSSFSNTSFLRAGTKPTTVLTTHVTAKEEVTTTAQPTEVLFVLKTSPLLPVMLCFCLTLLPLLMFFCLLYCFFHWPLPE